MTASQGSAGWNFSYKVDAAIPAFGITEAARSTATADLCSLELVKDGTRGKKQIKETTTFDAGKLMVTRTTGTSGGGKTEMRMNACAKDALTYIQFLRNELAAGRLPSGQPVYYGAGYQTRVQYIGTQKMRSGSEVIEADKLNATFKGPASEMTVELFFRRDPARTPLMVQIPVAVGRFTVEFER